MQLTTVPSAGYTDVTNGLVGWWKFDEGSGTSATDSAGSNTGTINGGSSYVTGKVGPYALSFDGSSGYVDTSINAGVTKTTPFSISAWAKKTPVSGSGEIVTTAIEDAPYDGVWFQWSANNKLVLSIVGNGSVEAIDASSAISAGTWHHVVTTYDGSQTIAGMKLYVDGSNIAVTNTTDNGFGTFTDRPWRIGTDRYTTPADYFNGSIDDVRIYNRALSAGEVLDLYNFTK
jgi:hypothetical protein